VRLVEVDQPMSVVLGVLPNLNSKTLPHEVGGLISFSFSPPQRARR
jgi:hypothetical protein